MALGAVGWGALPGAVAKGPLVVGEMIGAEDFGLTVIGNAGTIRLLFGPVGGTLADDATPFTTGGKDAVTLGTGARASVTEGFESLGGVGPGAGDAVEIGVVLLPTAASSGLSFTGSSLGACRPG